MTGLTAGIGHLFTEVARRRGDAEALIAGGERRSFAIVEASANRLARALAARGVGAGDYVALALPNGWQFIELSLAAWKVGGTVFPLSHKLPEREFDELVELGSPRVVIGERGAGVDQIYAEASVLDTRPLPDVPSQPWKAIGSGGSTGRSKLIVDSSGHPSQVAAGAEMHAMFEGQVHLIAGPLYHNGPFVFGLLHLLVGGTVVVMERFDPVTFLDLVERERVAWTFVVPTMLNRIFRLPEDQLAGRDVSSMATLLHSAAPCPAWLKRKAIDLFGPSAVLEAYASTEAGGTLIRGDEWLDHPGSVGKPDPPVAVKILDEAGEPLPAGEVGHIWIRPAAGPAFEYRGAEASISDGFVNVGDLGYLDADGYLYVADRRMDLIISGGANIYPAEVEAVLLEHPAVADAAVLGLKDDDWGQRVHAVVVLDASAAATAADLVVHCRSRLASYKMPKSVELVDVLPRDESGKLRRSAMRAEREAAVVRG